MWNRFSINIQLIIFITLVVSLVEIATLFIVHNIQENESKKEAVSKAKSLTQSLNNDLLRIFLNPTADALADITYRISAFETLKTLLLFNDKDNKVFQYGNALKVLPQKSDTVFTEKSLYIKQEIKADGYVFGHVVMEIDLSSYLDKQQKITFIFIIIFPLALLFGFVLSIYLSRSYTRPFAQLIDAMNRSDPANQKIVKISTSARNEIRELFNGYESLMQQVQHSTQALRYQLTHDQLTGILNRYAIEDALKNTLADKSSAWNHLLLIDLDQFKLINDAAGHQAGDEALKMITQVFIPSLPEHALFGRVDGDAFMVLTTHCSQIDGEKLLQNALETLRDFRFVWEGKAYSICASIGLVTFHAFEYTLEELIKVSNASLYTAKTKGRNKGYIYNPTDDTSKRMGQEALIASYIQEALEKGASKFELYAQSIVPLQNDDSKQSYEILLRMIDRNGNFISPGDFLPTAERYQLMTQVDSFVLWQYLEIVSQNPAHIENLHKVHINLAGSSLNSPDFQNTLKKAIEVFEFPWDRLELELTETSAVGNFNNANHFISWMKTVGIGLALDDFGTGMASFEYLKSLPFDVVKIDGSFIKDMHNDPIDKAVIKYIQEIANLKGQETVAEYIESQEDIELLKEIGITYGQGFYLGKPQSLYDMIQKRNT